jgi:hypothetical protein
MRVHGRINESQGLNRPLPVETSQGGAVRLIDVRDTRIDLDEMLAAGKAPRALAALPAFESCTRERSHPRRLDVFLPQQGQSSFAYVLDSEAIFAHHDVARRRHTEAVYAQHVTAIADVAMPSLRCTCLDGKSRRDRRQ